MLDATVVTTAITIFTVVSYLLSWESSTKDCQSWLYDQLIDLINDQVYGCMWQEAFSPEMLCPNHQSPDARK